MKTSAEIAYHFLAHNGKLLVWGYSRQHLTKRMSEVKEYLDKWAEPFNIRIKKDCIVRNDSSIHFVCRDDVERIKGQEFTTVYIDDEAE